MMTVPRPDRPGEDAGCADCAAGLGWAVAVDGTIIAHHNSAVETVEHARALLQAGATVDVHVPDHAVDDQAAP